MCTDSIYDEYADDVSCGVFELKAAKRWGDWTIGGEICQTDRCCALNEDDCCEANAGAITGLVVAIFVVLAMCCYTCAGCPCPQYPCCPDDHFCFSADRIVNNHAVHSKSVWRRCCLLIKGTRGNAVAPVSPGVSDLYAGPTLYASPRAGMVYTTRDGETGYFPDAAAPPADDSTVVAHLQLVTGASAEAARAALAAHGNDADAAAAALLAAKAVATEEKRQRLAAEARAAEAERKLRAAEERSAEERRQRAAEEEAERQRQVRAATQKRRDALPSYWKPIMNRLNAKKFSVDPGSEEYACVETAFMLALDDPSRNLKRTQFTIQSVDRIQNMELWNLYVAKRKSICGRRSPKDAQNLVRNWLFHGCRPENSDQILQQGFNRSFAGRNAMM